MAIDKTNWTTATLQADLRRIRFLLDAISRTGTEDGDGSLDDVRSPVMNPPHFTDFVPAPTLQFLVEGFGLSAFERDFLMLCAGPELDPGLANAIQRANGSSDPRPTFSLALAALPEGHWSAISPGSPLRRWKMIELETGPLLTHRPVRIDERVLHYLTGTGDLDPRLEHFVQRAPSDSAHPTAIVELAQTVSEVWRGRSSSEAPIVEFAGPDVRRIRKVAQEASSILGLSLLELDASTLLRGGYDQVFIARILERESILGRHSILVDGSFLIGSDPHLEQVLERFIGHLAVPLFTIGVSASAYRTRETIELSVPGAEPDEIRFAIQDAVPATMLQSDKHLDGLLSNFRLNPEVVARLRSKSTELSTGKGAGDQSVDELVTQTVREYFRPRLESVTQRIEPAASWDDLVLPVEQLKLLQTIALQVRYRGKVYEDWGFRTKGERGLGISALFAGASGTGKTMAAEVIARELGVDLYRIDLASVVSKYIGETEKNLRKIFDAAEGAGAILLFDEADALFGKRSEVTDSHDRYANIEVGYLLQQMEAYQGLAILTTNFRNAIDAAFTRRVRFIVQFPFPDREQRARIWERVFPDDTPIECLEWDRLANLNVTGGTIRNIGLSAAFFAAGEGSPVGMRHLLEAARQEYAKLDRTLTETEVSGWE